MSLPDKDLQIVRELARRKLEIAHDPVNLERKQAWYNLDSGENERPMVLACTGGLGGNELPVTEADLRCESPGGRRLERGLRTEIYQFETLADDHVVEPDMTVNWQVRTSDFGVEVVRHRKPNEQGHGAWKVDPPIKDLDADFDQLSPRTYSVDRASTRQAHDDLAAIFDGILPVNFRGNFWWSMGMTGQAINLIGLEELMMAMYDNPAGLHRIMGFLRDDHIAFGQWLEEGGLLTLNNWNAYIGSGGLGYSNYLPQSDFDGAVRRRDQWVLLESQETVGVGPALFEEFILPYQVAVAETFGRVYYGCCEPVDSRWQQLTRIPGLARVSVSPWADQPMMAEALGRDYVFSRKPNPTLVSTGTFDEDANRADLRQTLAVAAGNRLEIVMKDVHTLGGEPDRLCRWVRLAREEIARSHAA